MKTAAESFYNLYRQSLGVIATCAVYPNKLDDPLQIQQPRLSSIMVEGLFARLSPADTHRPTALKLAQVFAKGQSRILSHWTPTGRPVTFFTLKKNLFAALTTFCIDRTHFGRSSVITSIANPNAAAIHQRRQTIVAQAGLSFYNQNGRLLNFVPVSGLIADEGILHTAFKSGLHYINSQKHPRTFIDVLAHHQYLLASAQGELRQHTLPFAG